MSLCLTCYLCFASDNELIEHQAAEHDKNQIHISRPFNGKSQLKPLNPIILVKSEIKLEPVINSVCEAPLISEIKMETDSPSSINQSVILKSTPKVMNILSNIQPHLSCPICQKKFTQMTSFELHREKHAQLIDLTNKEGCSCNDCEDCGGERLAALTTSAEKGPEVAKNNINKMDLKALLTKRAQRQKEACSKVSDSAAVSVGIPTVGSSVDIQRSTTPPEDLDNPVVVQNKQSAGDSLSVATTPPSDQHITSVGNSHVQLSTPSPPSIVTTTHIVRPNPHNATLSPCTSLANTIENVSDERDQQSESSEIGTVSSAPSQHGQHYFQVSVYKSSSRPNNSGESDNTPSPDQQQVSPAGGSHSHIGQLLTGVKRSSRKRTHNVRYREKHDLHDRELSDPPKTPENTDSGQKNGGDLDNAPSPDQQRVSPAGGSQSDVGKLLARFKRTSTGLEEHGGELSDTPKNPEYIDSDVNGDYVSDHSVEKIKVDKGKTKTKQPKHNEVKQTKSHHKDFVCCNCKKAYGHKQSLHRHMTNCVHGVMFYCTNGCGRRYMYRNHMNRHLRENPSCIPDEKSNTGVIGPTKIHSIKNAAALSRQSWDEAKTRRRSHINSKNTPIPAKKRRSHVKNNDGLEPSSATTSVSSAASTSKTDVSSAASTSKTDVSSAASTSKTDVSSAASTSKTDVSSAASTSKTDVSSAASTSKTDVSSAASTSKTDVSPAASTRKTAIDTATSELHPSNTKRTKANVCANENQSPQAYSIITDVSTGIVGAIAVDQDYGKPDFDRLIGQPTDATTRSHTAAEPNAELIAGAHEAQKALPGRQDFANKMRRFGCVTQNPGKCRQGPPIVKSFFKLMGQIPRNYEAMYGQSRYIAWIHNVRASNTREPCLDVRPAITVLNGGHVVGANLGVFATKSFVATEPIAIYDGVHHDFEEMEYEERKADANGTFDQFRYTLQVHGKWKGKAMQLCVDATQESLFVGRLINHSKFEPNSRPITVYDAKEDRLWVIIIATKYIRAGAEVRYAYHIKDRNYALDFPWDES